MKYVAVVLLLMTAGTGASQIDSVRIANMVAPNRHFRTVTEVSSQTEISYSGPDSVMQAMKTLGMGETTTVEVTQRHVMTSHTGAEEPDGSILITMNVDSVFIQQIVNGQTMKVPQGMGAGSQLLGRYNDGTFTLEQIPPGSMDSAMASAFGDMMANMFEVASFTDTVIHVGETYTQVAPMTLPALGSSDIVMTIVSDYTLDSVSSGIAFFSIFQNYELSSRSDLSNLDASGYGSGIMELDTENNLMRLMELTSYMEMPIPMQKVNSITRSETNIHTENWLLEDK